MEGVTLILKQPPSLSTLDARYVNVSGDTMTGQLMIDGSADEIQLLVQGHSSQSNPLMTLEQSDGTDVFTVANSGEAVIGDGTVTASLGNSVVMLLETTTPGAVANYGKIYTKNDNKLYFQDGAGNEHEVAFV